MSTALISLQKEIDNCKALSVLAKENQVKLNNENNTIQIDSKTSNHGLVIAAGTVNFKLNMSPTETYKKALDYIKRGYPKEAANCFKESFVKEGYLGGFVAYAKCIKLGYGVEKDEKFGIQMLQGAAQMEDLEAQIECAMICLESDNIKDIEEGIRLLRKPVTSRIAKAEYLLGCCYQEGKGVPKNEEIAMDLFLRANSGTERDWKAEFKLAEIFYKAEIIMQAKLRFDKIVRQNFSGSPYRSKPSHWSLSEKEYDEFCQLHADSLEYLGKCVPGLPGIPFREKSEALRNQLKELALQKKFVIESPNQKANYKEPYRNPCKEQNYLDLLEKLSIRKVKDGSFQEEFCNSAQNLVLVCEGSHLSIKAKKIECANLYILFKTTASGYKTCEIEENSTLRVHGDMYCFGESLQFKSQDCKIQVDGTFATNSTRISISHNECGSFSTKFGLFFGNALSQTKGIAIEDTFVVPERSQLKYCKEILQIIEQNLGLSEKPVISQSRESELNNALFIPTEAVKGAYQRHIAYVEEVQKEEKQKETKEKESQPTSQGPGAPILNQQAIYNSNSALSNTNGVGENSARISSHIPNW